MEKACPLGNLTSQYFANFYLTRFDHWIKQEKRARFYLRYMDDMLIIGNKAMLCQLRDDSRHYLDKALKLELKNGGQINRTDKGIGFPSLPFPSPTVIIENWIIDDCRTTCIPASLFWGTKSVLILNGLVEKSLHGDSKARAVKF